MDDNKAPGIRATIDATAGTVTWTFVGSDLPPVTVYADTLSSDIRDYAALHGLKQKIGDAAAMVRNPDTGRSATLADKRDAMVEILSRLVAGEWNKRREGTATGGYLLRALCILKPEQSREALTAWLAGKSEAEKAALRRNPKVAVVIADLQAEDGRSSGIDSDELLADL